MIRTADRDFVPVLHAAALDRPDEQDTVLAAQGVAESLARLGYGAEILRLDLDLSRLSDLKRRAPLAAFNLVDAVDGDCRLAPLVPLALEHFGIPVTGASSKGWLATFSKLLTKQLLRAAELPTPEWSENGTGLDHVDRVVVKAIFEHGSLGLDDASVMAPGEALGAVRAAEARFGTPFFAEGFIEGREFNVALLEGEDGPRVLPIPEILFGVGFGGGPKIVGYDAKWEPETSAFVETPRAFGLEAEKPALAEELRRHALTCWRIFGLSGYARVDFRVDEADRPWILEVNVNPCLTPDAGFPAAAAEAGIGYDDLIGIILAAALSKVPESSQP